MTRDEAMTSLPRESAAILPMSSSAPMQSALGSNTPQFDDGRRLCSPHIRAARLASLVQGPTEQGTGRATRREAGGPE